jgi:hypothetical protein
MFKHAIFEVYDFNNIPLDTELYLQDEAVIEEYESSLLKLHNGGEWDFKAVVSRVTAKRITESSIELVWYVGVFDRWHEMPIVLPRDQVVICASCENYNEKPTIFVKSEWLINLHLKSNSVFGLIDADGIKTAINNGTLTRNRLQLLKSKIDELASRHCDISFISFADSILLKSHWTAGHFKTDVKYTYKPEIFIHLFRELQLIYREVLELNVYGIFTQGTNEYYDDPLLHISKTKNHVCLNSLGMPFAELLAIERAARKAIKDSIHSKQEIYMDAQYFKSLKLNYEFRRNRCGRNEYKSVMNTEVTKKYFYSSYDDVIANLK